MKNRGIILLLFLVSSLNGFAQNIEKQERFANTQMREGNEMFQKSNYADAEVSYKKSVATYPNNPKAIYNLGNAMMHQKRYKEAITQYDYLAKSAKSNALRAQSYHNIGNAYMGLNDFQKAVDTYKSSLRINPKDEETRYNLALAQELLKQQQDQNKDNKDDKNKDDKNKDQDNKENDKKEDQKDKDKKEENKDDKNKDEDDKDDKKDKSDEDKQDPKEEKGDEDKKQRQPQPGKLSQQQMKQLLEALQNEENKTQDKMNAKRVKGQKVKTEKDW